jgi:hypothetical protein
MYTKAAVWATSATPLPMWDVDGSGMVPLPNVVAVFRDRKRSRGLWLGHVSHSPQAPHQGESIPHALPQKASMIITDFDAIIVPLSMFVE